MEKVESVFALFKLIELFYIVKFDYDPYITLEDMFYEVPVFFRRFLESEEML